MQHTSLPVPKLWESQWGPEKGEEAAACVQTERWTEKRGGQRRPGFGHGGGVGGGREAGPGLHVFC